MSFLARLIERHREDGPASLDLLEPRLPSRFEPVTPPETPLDIARDVSVEAPALTDATPLIPSRGWQPPGDRPPAETPESRVSAVRSALAAAPRTIAVPPPPAVSDAPANLPLRSYARSATPTPAPSTDPAEPAPRPTPARPTVVAAVARARQEILGPPAPSSTLRVERDPATPASEPTIHVTIGRVDVRAIVAATPASPRPTPVVQKRSLEDYLRRRDRAGR